MALKVGVRINDKYEVLKVIDSGGMSTVYIALDLNLNKQWALKEITKRQTKEGNLEYKSLITETNLLKELDHVYLPRIVDIIEDTERIFVVMDFIEGKTLEDVIASKGGLPQEKMLKWAIQLTQVMGYLHSRKPPIIYRDMKPDNIMLQPNGNIKLFDFGASREYVNEESWKTAPLGTKGYAAPERYGSSKKGVFDERSDIYELGMTFYHMITGHNPSKSPEKIKPIPEWNPDINKGLVKVVEKMTETDPDNRYQNTTELLYDLQNYVELDPEYKLKITRNLKTVVISAVVTLALFFLGGTSIYTHSAISANSFEEKLLLAKEHMNTSLALEATHIKKGSIKPYLTMIDIFKTDNRFTTMEEVELLSAINLNKTDLENSSEYGDLAYALAKLYFYRGSEVEDPLNKQLTWLNTSIERTKNSTFMKSMKNYMQVSSKLNDESPSIELYKQQWANISSILSAPYYDTFEELTNIKIMQDFIFTNVGSLKESGVTQEDLLSRVESSNKKLKNLNTQEESEISLAEPLNSSYDQLVGLITTTYQ